MYTAHNNDPATIFLEFTRRWILFWLQQDIDWFISGYSIIENKIYVLPGTVYIVLVYL